MGMVQTPRGAPAERPGRDSSSTLLGLQSRLGGQTSQILSNVPPKRDCGPERVKQQSRCVRPLRVSRTPVDGIFFSRGCVILSPVWYLACCEARDRETWSRYEYKVLLLSVAFLKRETEHEKTRKVAHQVLPVYRLFTPECTRGVSSTFSTPECRECFRVGGLNNALRVLGCVCSSHYTLIFAYRHPAHSVSVPIRHPGEIDRSTSSVTTTSGCSCTEKLRCNAASREDNAMPCHLTGYERHSMGSTEGPNTGSIVWAVQNPEYKQ